VCPLLRRQVTCSTQPHFEQEHPLPLRVLPLGRGRVRLFISYSLLHRTADCFYRACLNEKSAKNMILKRRTHPFLSSSHKASQPKHGPLQLPSCQGGVPGGRGGCLLLVRTRRQFKEEHPLPLRVLPLGRGRVRRLLPCAFLRPASQADNANRPSAHLFAVSFPISRKTP